ncbi:Imm10 family immunity protein [Kribbella yunnanensis]|uniref:Imm10 family immunity protein n=1 Tax=Kribbella yunnanensis TaxID=190194 RepID=UPI0031DD6644
MVYDLAGTFTNIAGFEQQADGKGFILLFQSGMEEPDEQEMALGFDTHCLVTANQGTAYGCVREVVLSGNTLHVSLDPEALVALGLGASTATGAPPSPTTPGTPTTVVTS